MYQSGGKRIKIYNKLLYGRWTTLARMISFILVREPKSMVLCILVTVLGGLLPLVSVYALQRLIESVSLNPKLEVTAVIVWGGLFFFTVLAQKLELVFGSLIMDHTQEKVRTALEREMQIKAQKLSLATFEQPAYYDKLERIQTGLEQRFFPTMTFIFRIISRAVAIISLTIYLVQLHIGIPILLVIGSIIFTFIKTKLFKEKYILQRKQTTEDRQLNDIADVMTSREASMEVRLFSKQDHYLNKWLQLNRKLKLERLNLAKRESRLEFIGSGGLILTLGIVFFSGLTLVSRGALTIGQYAAFITSVKYFNDELEGLFTELVLISNDLRYIEDFFEYIELENNCGVTRNIQQNTLLKQEGIVFHKVSFYYPGTNKPIIKDLSFKISIGERISLLGNNGSGKSTLIKLILGLYEPTKGEITVDGINLKELDKAHWLNYVGAVFQNFGKYHLSIRENIGFGNISKIDNDEIILSAAKVAGIEPYINKLPKGLDTMIGKEFQGGTDLSGGQWQRLATARAYFSDASLLVLDEPTSALDPKAEVEVYEQFNEISKGKTVIFVSHRLGATKLTDRIIHLHNGEIVEDGSHSELLKKKGFYYRMYQKQSIWYTKENDKGII